MADKAKIKHLIILMMENRSFDHYLGALALIGHTEINGLAANIAPNPSSGKAIAPWAMDSVDPGYPDPPHGWNPAHADYRNGNNDGFVQQYEACKGYQDWKKKVGNKAHPGIPMGYYTEKTLPVYYALAEQFFVCDNWFASTLSSTWPNRKFLHSGRRDGDSDTQTLPPFPGFETRPMYEVIEKFFSEELKRNLSWKCYFTDLPFLSFWYRFAASHIRNFKPVVEFVEDCREDDLPDISIIDPPFSLADDHPSHDPKLGQKFAGLIVDALTNSDSWESSALVILYDENGGFYDHVAPPQAPENTPAEKATNSGEPLGFRVPAIVVSPYSHKRTTPTPTPLAEGSFFDHTSIMTSINERWGVAFDTEFGVRWDKMPGIWDKCFDFNRPAIPRGIYTGDPLRELNWGGSVHALLEIPVDPLLNMMERIFHLEELKHLDLRADVFNLLRTFEQRVISMKAMTKLSAAATSPSSPVDPSKEVTK